MNALYDKMTIVKELSKEMDTGKYDIFKASEILKALYPEYSLENAIDVLIGYRTNKY
jgi:hypothetical protein